MFVFLHPDPGSQYKFYHFSCVVQFGRQCFTLLLRNLLLKDNLFMLLTFFFSFVYIRVNVDIEDYESSYFKALNFPGIIISAW